MQNYMIIMRLPDYFTPDFVALIPQQRAHVNRLFQEHRISSYSLAMDRSYVWACMPGESADEVLRAVAKFPLYKYMKVEVQALAFHESASIVLPKISLN
jgi:muconolactone delta-isomerase